MKNLTWQNPGQLFVAQELIKIVKLKCCGIKVNKKERSKEVNRDSDDTLDMKYNRLMSDAKKDRLIKIMRSHEVGLLDKDPMPFTIMMNPKTIKTRSKYFELLKNYRKEKEK